MSVLRFDPDEPLQWFYPAAPDTPEPRMAKTVEEMRRDAEREELRRQQIQDAYQRQRQSTPEPDADLARYHELAREQEQRNRESFIRGGQYRHDRWLTQPVLDNVDGRVQRGVKSEPVFVSSDQRRYWEAQRAAEVAARTFPAAQRGQVQHWNSFAFRMERLADELAEIAQQMKQAFRDTVDVWIDATGIVHWRATRQDVDIPLRVGHVIDPDTISVGCVSIGQRGTIRSWHTPLWRKGFIRPPPQ